MLLGCLPIVTMLAEGSVSPATWALLAASILVWPHVALLLARRSKRPIVIEKRNLAVDTMITVFWLAATGFSPLPAVALLAMQATDKLSVGGTRFLINTWLGSLPAAALAWWIYRPEFAPAISSLTMLACLPNLIFYPLAVGALSFRLTRQLVEQRKELRRLNRDDGLTGVANRRYWEEVVALELSRHKRTLRSATVLLIDIDALRLINDRQGQAVGDALLREIGHVLRLVSREIDTAGRIGDDSFGLILPETDIGQARQIAERIRDEITGLTKAGLPATTVSIGMASNSVDLPDASRWIALADLARYRAKTTEGGSIQSWPQTGTTATGAGSSQLRPTTALSA